MQTDSPTKVKAKLDWEVITKLNKLFNMSIESVLIKNMIN